MARPKKNSETPAARQRILDAFWNQLDQATLHELSVSSICNEAGCNRGTFYYHFTDMDDLVFTATEEELLWSRGVSRVVFSLITHPDNNAIRYVASSERIRRLTLIAKKCDNWDVIESKLKSTLVDMWTAILCPDGEKLTMGVRCAIEYSTSGILGMLTSGIFAEAPKDENDLETVGNFARNAARFMLGTISESQNLSKEEVILRLKAFNRITQLQG